MNSITSPPDFISTIVKDYPSLAYFFNKNKDDLFSAITLIVNGLDQKVTLVGSHDDCQKILKNCHLEKIKTSFIKYDFQTELALNENNCDYYLFCTAPTSDAGWSYFDELKNCNPRILALWDYLPRLAVMSNLFSYYDYNRNSFYETMEMYQFGNDNFSKKLDKISQIENVENYFKDKRVLELGPSDGNHSVAIVDKQPSSLTAIEGRPENIVKWEAARNCFGWKNANIVPANFMSLRSEDYDHIDVVVACGVCYHVDSPFYFIQKLTQISDQIFISSWFANSARSVGSKTCWDIDGVSYSGEIYHEPDHFLAGLQTTSVYLDYESFCLFVQNLGYEVHPVELEFDRNEVTGKFGWLWLKRAKQNQSSDEKNTKGVCPPTLESHGFFDAGALVNPDEAFLIREFLSAKMCFPHHCEADAIQRGMNLKSLVSVRSINNFAVYRRSDVISAPYVLEIATNKKVLATISDYLGGPIVLTSIDCWWSFSNGGTKQVTQNYHRDASTGPFCALFVYLTDVLSEIDGAHVYVGKSHKIQTFSEVLSNKLNSSTVAKLIHASFHKNGNETPFDEIIPQIMPECVSTIFGVAGTATVTDPNGLHRGQPVSGSDRLMLSFRYKADIENIEPRIPPIKAIAVDAKDASLIEKHSRLLRHIITT